jgi:ribonuclease III
MTVTERAQRVLGDRFRYRALLDQALSHRSSGAVNNERLEFLGDSVLELVISEDLYRRFPGASEGQLSRTRASIVKEPTLARVARSLDLGKSLRLGGGELKSGGYDRDSILADALEAIIGALYLDGGLDAARDFIFDHFEEEIRCADPDRVHKDPKTLLQEYLQGRGREVPEYELMEASGVAHEQVFVVHCRLPGDDRLFRGVGPSKRKAEQDAAAQALAVLMTPKTRSTGRAGQEHD